MSSYLIVDVDDIIEYLKGQPTPPKLSDSIVALRNTAALAAGLTNADKLVAVALADWNKHNRPDQSGVNVQQVFVSTGYDLFNVPERRFVVDALLAHYFPPETEASIEEMIIASGKSDLINLVARMNLPPHVRVRVWSDVSPSKPGMIFQPLESILGVQTKSVALYVDFENITISLNEQGYIVDLDLLVDGLKRRSEHYGQTVHVAAYAPWGQRGSLPPMLDMQGREISDDIPSKLAMESIDPVFSLPGKNSADLRIAKDVLAESNVADSPEVIIIASGDRDFNDIYNSLRAKGKQVVVWGVRGSTSRVLEMNTAITLEYVDDFVAFRRHNELLNLYPNTEDRRVVAEDDAVDLTDAFRPSQWSSLILQIDLLTAAKPTLKLTVKNLAEQLDEVNTTANFDRAEDLIEQAIKIGILTIANRGKTLSINPNHPIVSKTRSIRDHIVHRVNNTLHVRQWDYVNYGFLLKGIAMDENLDRPGINVDDNWRSEWIDFLVREDILVRELIPHRHNPDDLVPVIRVPDYSIGVDLALPGQDTSDKIIEQMEFRVIVSVEQFTSFRKFAWCPLGSLHKRLRDFDNGAAFQRAVEELVEKGAVNLEEYPNPQSDYLTKGVSINEDSELTQQVLAERNFIIRVLLEFYDQRRIITFESLQQALNMNDERLELWMSIMELENVLNPVPGHPGQYSLFRTHHTVSLVAEDV